MKKLTRDTVFYAFSGDLEPALEIDPGEKVQMETHDCFCGQVQTEADTVEDLDWGRVNPATGPVYIRGALPGDILAVDIEDVRVADQGAMGTVPGEGALGDIITEPETSLSTYQAVSRFLGHSAQHGRGEIQSVDMWGGCSQFP